MELSKDFYDFWYGSLIFVWNSSFCMELVWI